MTVSPSEQPPTAPRHHDSRTLVGVLTEMKMMSASMIVSSMAVVKNMFFPRTDCTTWEDRGGGGWGGVVGTGTRGGGVCNAQTTAHLEEAWLEDRQVIGVPRADLLLADVHHGDLAW